MQTQRTRFHLLLLLLLSISLCAHSAESHLITISTTHTSLVLSNEPSGRLLQLGYGARGHALYVPPKRSSREFEWYPQYGDGFGDRYLPEPALQVTHADGNTSTDLLFVRQSQTALDQNISLTRVETKDPAYPFAATFCFKAYSNEDVIEMWTEIRHEENKPVVLHRYDSCAPLLLAREYWLTHLAGDWSKEASLYEERLTPGLKLVESRLGTRAGRYATPSFMVALDGRAAEEQGEVIGGSLEWSGSFELAFEIDSKNRLRALCGINPLGEEYHLEPGKVFKTPGVLWSWSNSGKGQVSRNFHRWARRYGIRDGGRPRPVLLNNWEATGFKFDEATLVSLFDGARQLGADTFLLDDGWFGNAHPRNDDRAGLGDWQVNTNKLPHGLGFLASEARKRGIDFGIWIEPEMVNPMSDLYEAHPQWAIQQPHRAPDLSRNQLVLDLSRPAVRDFEWGVIDNTLSDSQASFVKWDCNRFVTQPGSTYLPADKQSDLMVDYVFNLYGLMAQMAQKHPDVMAMVCSGGGARADYGALRFFHEFWTSDNTDPLHRVFIQWGFSHFFPGGTLAAHVTRMGKRPLKFAEDVAMSGAMGLDLDSRKLSPEETRNVASAIALYKKDVRDIVEQGDLHRLESPYQNPRAALEYVAPDASAAVVFVYQLTNAAPVRIKLRGLKADGTYLVRELNLPAGDESKMESNGERVAGATLMSEGIRPACAREFDSAVIKFSALK